MKEAPRLALSIIQVSEPMTVSATQRASPPSLRTATFQLQVKCMMWGINKMGIANSFANISLFHSCFSTINPHFWAYSASLPFPIVLVRSFKFRTRYRISTKLSPHPENLIRPHIPHPCGNISTKEIPITVNMRISVILAPLIISPLASAQPHANQDLTNNDGFWDKKPMHTTDLMAGEASKTIDATITSTRMPTSTPRKQEIEGVNELWTSDTTEMTTHGYIGRIENSRRRAQGLLLFGRPPASIMATKIRHMTAFRTRRPERRRWDLCWLGFSVSSSCIKPWAWKSCYRSSLSLRWSFRKDDHPIHGRFCRIAS